MLNEIVDTLIARSRENRCMVLAITGIDGSGKSTISREIATILQWNRLNTALISLDSWHNLPEIRFDSKNPGQHFYNHAFRFTELFELLINPLKERRSIHLQVQLTRLPENDVYLHTYDFSDVDVIVLEGIFLLKRELIFHYDFSIWLECSFETALERALQRNQEGLSEAEIVHDYNTIYFPAQKIHLARDDPKSNATWILPSPQSYQDTKNH